MSLPHYQPLEVDGLDAIYAITEEEVDGESYPGTGLQRVVCEVKGPQKVAKRPVYESVFAAGKGRKNLDAPSWVGRDRLFAWIKEPGHIAGIVAYFFGIVVLDIDHEDGQAMVERIIAIYGKPLAIVRTGSGGYHLLYPINMAATPNAEAHLIWPGTKFYIDGEAVGETLGCERMAALWQPDVWAAAINDRSAIRDAGEDPSTLGLAFLDPDAIDRGPKHAHTESRESPLPPDADEQQAILAAAVDTLGLKPDGEGGWQGNCPCGEESRSETRFKARMKGERAVFHCFACENSNFDKSAWVGEMAAPYREAKDEANKARTAGVLSKSKQNPTAAAERHSFGEGLKFSEKRPVFAEMEDLFRDFFRYEVRQNVRSFDDEYRPLECRGEWEPITDRVMANWVKRVGQFCTRFAGIGKNKKPFYRPDYRTIESFTKDFAVWFSEADAEVDPFIDWIEAECSEFHGTPRLDTWMRDAGFVITNGVEDYVRWVCRYVFLGAIQRAYEPGCELQQIPVLWGARGTGKSSIAEYALPEEMRAKWFGGDFYISPDPKLMIEKTEGKVIMEWQELRGIKRLEPEEIKAYLSGRYDRARKAYMKRAEDVPRRGIIIGTTNEPTLKADPALMRRIVVLHVAEGSDVGAIRAYLDTHRTQLFAEALVRYRAGERAHLDYHLEDGLDLNNSGAVYRNWNAVETISEVVTAIGTSFTKTEFCDAIGEFPPNSGAKEQARLRDRWWRDNGRLYTKALIDLGFVEKVKNGRRFVLEDRSIYDATMADSDRPGITLDHPGITLETPICAGVQHEHPTVKRVKNQSTQSGVSIGNAKKGDTPETLRIQGPEGRYRVIPEHPSEPNSQFYRWTPPDDLDGEEG